MKEYFVRDVIQCTGCTSPLYIVHIPMDEAIPHVGETIILDGAKVVVKKAKRLEYSYLVPQHGKPKEVGLVVERRK